VIYPYVLDTMQVMSMFVVPVRVIAQIQTYVCAIRVFGQEQNAIYQCVLEKMPMILKLVISRFLCLSW
jgi:hypothetical protein